MVDSAKPQAQGLPPSGRSTLADVLKEPIGAFQSAITSVHDALGIPWWATIVGAGICARAATLPLSLRAAAAGTNFHRARKAVHASMFRLIGDAGFETCTPALAPHAERLPMLTQQLARRPHNRMWLLAPVAQVPLLAIGTFSMMSLEHPALATEGCLWFPDLLKGALSWQGVWEVVSAGDVYITNEESEALRAAIAPMGLYGVILPTAFYLIWRDNLANAMLTVSSFFMRTFGQSTFESGVLKGRSRAQTGINRNVKVTKVLSVCIYPVLITAPTVGLLYLTASSATAWLTFRLLPIVSAALQRPSTSKNITTTNSKPFLDSASRQEGRVSRDYTLDAAEKEHAPAAAMASIASSTLSSGGNSFATTVTTSESSIAELQSSTDVEYLLDASILSHAKKHTRVALVAAQRAQQLQPKHARITFAVAQLQRDLRQWKAAILELEKCLLLEPACNSAHRARVLATKSTCFLELLNPSEALQAATAAVLLQPDEPMHWMAKMNALRSSGNISEAINDAKHIAELDPDLGKDLPAVLEKLQSSRKSKGSPQRV